MLTFNKINVSVNGIDLVKDFSLTIFHGACVIIKGKNGSGKTTLLKSLSGIVALGSGKIFYNENDIINHIKEYNSLICHIGHGNALNLELTVLENLEYWATLNNRIDTITAASIVFDLQELFHTKVGNLSKGWQRKVALTRLLLTNAEIWFLDEPYTNLDQASCTILDNLIFSKCSQNGIVIVASHIKENIFNSINVCMEDFK